MLYDYLLANYKAAEPIFFSDIKIEGISRPALNQHMRRLLFQKFLCKPTGDFYTGSQ